MYNQTEGTTFQAKARPGRPIQMFLFDEAVDRRACNLVSVPVTDKKTELVITLVQDCILVGKVWFGRNIPII